MECKYVDRRFARKKTEIIFKKIKKLGKKYKLTYSGMHTLDILRLEKKFLHWGHDITSENNPFESGLSFTVNFKKKENFIGRAALEKIKEKPLTNRLKLFSLKNKFKPGSPLLLHDEPIFRNNEIVGSVETSNNQHLEDILMEVTNVSKLKGNDFPPKERILDRNQKAQNTWFVLRKAVHIRGLLT